MGKLKKLRILDLKDKTIEKGMTAFQWHSSREVAYREECRTQWGPLERNTDSDSIKGRIDNGKCLERDSLKEDVIQ